MYPGAAAHSTMVVLTGAIVINSNCIVLYGKSMGRVSGVSRTVC